MLVAGALVLCAAIGFAGTRLGEHRLEAEQHAALQRALDEFHAASGDSDEFDDAQIRLIERRAEPQEPALRR